MYELTPWRPFRELAGMRRDLDRLWEDFFGEREFPTSEYKWVPPVDVSETKDEVIVKLEVPGIEKKDIEISLTGDVLTIKGEKKQKVEEKDENYHRIETRYGAFARAIRIPISVDAAKVKAKYDKGVLRISLPKTEEVKPKQIEIKTE